jgi:CBS domain containing-hemolysin-like protein
VIAAWAFLAFLFLIAAGFYSGTEMGLYSLNRLRLRLRVGRTGDAAARALLELANRREQSVLAILLTQNVMNYLLAVATVSLILEATHMSSEAAEVYGAIILSPITFVFGDVVPKNWFQSQANRLMYPSVRLVQACVAVFRYTGVLWVLSSITRLLARLTGQEAETAWRGARSEILGLLQETAATGTLSEEQTRMMERVMNLSTVRVGSIMIPRNHVVGLPANLDRAAFGEIVRRYNYSRLPVFSPDRRSVVGVVNVYDVLADDTGGPLNAWVRPPLEIQASLSAMQALLQMRQGQVAMGMVVDPRRGFVGILTLKDLVEEIFGELWAW